MYLVTYQADGDFMAEFMRMQQIADIYRYRDDNGTSDHKVYRLTPDAEPEPLKIAEEWKNGSRTVVLQTLTGKCVARWKCVARGLC